MNTNKRSFNLVVKTIKTFSLYLNDFEFATTLLMNLRNKIKITFIGTYINAVFTTIRVRRIKLLVSVVKLITSIVQTINVKKIRIIAVAKERITNSIAVRLRLVIVFISKAIQKANSTIILKKIKITAIPVLATFFTLGFFDPSTLLTLDTKTLGEMDYTT